MCVLGSQSISKYDAQDLRLIEETKLESEWMQDFDLARGANVINVTPADQIYSIKNLPKFKKDSIPKQAWSLCLQMRSGKDIAKIPLTVTSEDSKAVMDCDELSKQLLKASMIDLKSLPKILLPGLGGF